MKIVDLNSLDNVKDFMIIKFNKAKIVFTNAEYERSFNRNTEEGVEELNSLKEEFNVDDIIYLKQIHSDKVLKYDRKNNIKDEDGDAIITNEKGVIIGVFTADCVPIILLDENTGVSAAIHSGWRGTYDSITYKTIMKMKQEYGVNEKNIKAFIGPHIKKCCYEVSKDLRDKFEKRKININKEKLFQGNNLNLEACIIDDLEKAGVINDNISLLNLCTYCSEDVKLHSYRKSEGSYGRMFAFITLF